MKTVIVYAHPWDGSYNHGLLEQLTTNLKEKGNVVSVLDLYSDGFNPVMEKADLKVFGKGEYADPLAVKYVAELKSAEELILVYPIWWYSEPAILKGFFDKVLLKKQVYDQDGKGQLMPLLSIKKSAVITTASVTEDQLRDYFGSPIESRVIKGIFGMIGVSNTTWIHCGEVHKAENREEHLSKVVAYARGE